MMINKTKLMKNAWRFATNMAKKGGQPVDYISAAMKNAWNIAKMDAVYDAKVKKPVFVQDHTGVKAHFVRAEQDHDSQYGMRYNFIFTISGEDVIWNATAGYTANKLQDGHDYTISFDDAGRIYDTKAIKKVTIAR